MRRSPADAASGFARAGVAIAALSAVLLPALVCGAQLDAPVTADEVARLRAAIVDPQGWQVGPAALYYGAMLPSADLVDQLERHVPTARIATVLAMLVLSGLLYLTLALAQSRGVALLACIALAGSPAVADASLRPEVPSAVFGLLGVLVLVGMPEQLRLAGRRGPRRAAFLVLLLAASVGVALGLAVASSSSYGVLLLVPGGCVLLAVALALAGFGRVLRRRGPTLPAFRGFTQRTAPWLCASLASIAGALLLLSMQGQPETAMTVRSYGLLPAPPLVAWALLGCGLAGASVWSLRIGLSLGKRRRVTADTVVFVYSATLLFHRLGQGAGHDALPAAPAFAIPIAIGARLILGATLARAVAARRG